VLYRVVAEQLETFLARHQERDHPLPGFVEREFRSFLNCGILERGFLRLRSLYATAWPTMRASRAMS
jgi:hypothetical protein